VELGVRVLDNVDSHNDHEHRVVIRGGLLHADFSQLVQTTYHFNNKSDTAQVVYLEHPRGRVDWELYGSPQPHEITESYWRFRFTIEPRKVSPFVVKQRQVVSRMYALQDVTDSEFSLFLERRYLDPKTAEALRAALALKAEAARLAARVKEREAERAGIHTEQTRIRDNLQALGDRHGEKELRDRFVRTLGTQEDRLEAIDREIREAAAAREQLRARMTAALAALEYEADIEPVSPGS
jgi:hypothetical protein